MSTSFVRCLHWSYLFTSIFFNAMEFVPLWCHCHRQNASRRSCWEAWGRVDGAARTRPNQSGCETKPTRVHLERCDSTRSHSMRGKMISAPTVSPPPLLPNPSPSSYSFQCSTTDRHKNSPPLYTRDFALLIRRVLSWIVGTDVDFAACLSYSWLIQSFVFYIQILAYRLKKIHIWWYILDNFVNYI